MSERMFAWLLRLYPSQFRETYGDEALQLLRDRARDEKGFFLKLRLWLDLLADFAVSVPHWYSHIRPNLVSASAPHYSDGLPSFRVLGGETPRQGALLLGGLLSLVTLAAFPFSIPHFSAHRAHGASILETQRAKHATPSRPAEAQGEHRAVTPPVVGSTRLDAAERRRVIHAAIANLKEHYIDRAGAQKIADALLAHEKNGDYDAVMGGPAFADLLTRQVRDVSQDMHLDVIYSQSPLPDRPPIPTAEGLVRYRKAMEQENCTFEKVDVLQHNIGYLKLNSFPDPSICWPIAAAALTSLNRADAIIFDLRDNRGGHPSMVMLIAAYLFDHPEYWYNPRENTTQQSWTKSPVPGSRLAEKPVYVLTSARTASGAEQFSYDLKMLKRATLVGETTRGVAHSGVFHRFDEHFGMGIRETEPINPFSSRDWEGAGVEPDVKANAADALEVAKKLATRK